MAKKTTKGYNAVHTRDMSFLKPARFSDHMTVVEVSRAVRRDPSRIRELERAGRIPKAQRVQRGTQAVRLWSPAQVEEIREIFATMRPGRPKGR